MPNDLHGVGKTTSSSKAWCACQILSPDVAMFLVRQMERWRKGAQGIPPRYVYPNRTQKNSETLKPTSVFMGASNAVNAIFNLCRTQHCALTDPGRHVSTCHIYFLLF